MNLPNLPPLQIRSLRASLLEAERYGVDLAARVSLGIPVDAERRAHYFEGCTRAPHHGEWLAAQVRAGVWFDFCAAARGQMEWLAAMPDEARPPWRSGALEIMRDTLAGRRLENSRWLTIGSVREAFQRGERRALPPPGSLAIFVRDAATGRGHVEQLVGWLDDVDRSFGAAYQAIGANEGNRGAWQLCPTALHHPQLKGFVVDDPSLDATKDWQDYSSNVIDTAGLLL